MLVVPMLLATALVGFGKPALDLQIDSCTGVDAAEVGRAVAVELRVAIGAVNDASTTQVSVGCRGPFYQVRVDEPTTQEVVVDTVVQRNYFELRVDDPLSGKTLRRLVDLRREPHSAQSRLLGIAISELVRASWLELVVNPTPVVPPLEKVEAPAVVQAVVERARPTLTTSISPSCGAMFYGRRGTATMFGCGLGVRASGSLWHAGANGDVYTASDDVALGSIDVTSATALLSAGAHATAGPVVLTADLGGRFGVMTVSGETDASSPVTGNATTAAWGGPAARATVEVMPLSWLAIGAALEAGYALLGVEGNALNDTLIDTRGFWLMPTGRVVFLLP